MTPPVKSQNVSRASQGNAHRHRLARFPPNGCRKLGWGQGEAKPSACPFSPGSNPPWFLCFSFPSKEAELWQCPSCKGKYSDLVGLSGLPSVLPFLSSDNCAVSFQLLPPSSSPPGRTGFPIRVLVFLRVREEHASEGGAASSTCRLLPCH